MAKQISQDAASQGAAKNKSSGNLFSGFMNFMGENDALVTQAHLPSELIGGGIPHIPGTEDEAVWNAAAQACGTERVHYCYTTFDNRIWYLATPSSVLASHPNSWCPLAAALPGNSEYWDQETIYLYEQEGAAGALRWDKDTGRLQVFLGAARTILPRIQSMDANFVTVNPDIAKPVHWRNRALRQEWLSRLIVKILVFSGLGVTFVSLAFLALSYMAANVLKPNLEEARESTREATTQLMIDASTALRSNANKHMARIIELNNIIAGFGGTLVKYDVASDGNIVWEALIPSAVPSKQLRAQAIGAEDGRIRIQGTR